MILKKRLLAFLFTLLLIPSVCFADFTVSSDSREFSVITGVYDLVGNVVVQFPARGSTMTITGDKATVQMYQQELHGNGNITLAWDGLKFSCDSVDVYHTERTAYLNGNLIFNANGHHITSNEGEYNWKTKIAVFSGNVIVNGSSKNGAVRYNFKTNAFQ